MTNHFVVHNDAETRLDRSAVGYVFAYEPKAMSSPMSVRLGDQSRSLRVLSDDSRLFSDRLIPEAALGGG